MSSDVEIQARVARLERMIEPLVQLAQNHDERMDYLTATMNDLGERMSALVDAQIRSEDGIAELTQRQQGLATGQDKFTASQERLAASQERLAASQERLTTAQEKLAIMQQELTITQQELAASHRELVASQRHTDERLNALIDIVIQGRNGDVT